MSLQLVHDTEKPQTRVDFPTMCNQCFQRNAVGNHGKCSFCQNFLNQYTSEGEKIKQQKKIIGACVFVLCALVFLASFLYLLDALVIGK